MDSAEFQFFLKEVLAVLVLYKTDINNSDTFKSLSYCLEKKSSKLDILIYDNSPLPMLNPKQLNEQYWHISYIHDETNPGVGKAYNTGYKIAKKMDKKWLLLLDQDTKFETDALIKYYQEVHRNPNSFLFAPILTSDTGELYSPCKYAFRRGFPLKNIVPGLHSSKNISLLNSGLFISMDIFGKVGGYNEKLKLDFSDFEFIDRYKQINTSFIIINTKCIHGFSAQQDSIEAALIRFGRYCESIEVLAKIHIDASILLFFAFFRACKLSFKFKNFRFFYIFYIQLINSYFQNLLLKLQKLPKSYGDS
ncbi:MAG: glycosyltransferase [Aulosira sp. ZfuVER01]|nr:glycosyltransferase [Aulosira sp. ZfuVER01]MDZ7999167.1 glycosyltransferase [Aulosira sp. DedVER01a]MDZ8051109.1 glycosyltransferase [Aulosira sp. ZfuCHP01]